MQVTSGLTCVLSEECVFVCACVFTVPKNLAQVRDNCLYSDSVLQDIVYHKHFFFLLNYLCGFFFFFFTHYGNHCWPPSVW